MNSGTAPDQGGQNQGKKHHSADPTDRGKHMEPDKEDRHRGRESTVSLS